MRLTIDNTARILDNKPKISSCSVVATAKDSPQGEIKMAEETTRRSMCSSSLYKSTLDDLMDEDKEVNVVSTTEDLKVFFLCLLSLSFSLSSILLSVILFDCPLQKKVEKHGLYISANQRGLRTRTLLSFGGFAVLVVILVMFISRLV